MKKILLKIIVTITIIILIFTPFLLLIDFHKYLPIVLFISNHPFFVPPVGKELKLFDDFFNSSSEIRSANKTLVLLPCS